MKQMIPTDTLTVLADQPGVMVKHSLGRNAWIEVEVDGSLRVEGTSTSTWAAYRNVGLTVRPIWEDAPIVPEA